LLRAIANGDDAKASKHDVIFNASAAEIESLRADLVAFRNAAADKMIALRAERDRLRAALKKIAEQCSECETIEGIEEAEARTYRAIVRMASRALEQSVDER
jgi:hypothetical protein